LALLYSFITKNNTLKQQEMVNYLFRQLELKVDQSTISRTLKREKITYKKAVVRYSEQKSRIKEIINFANYFKFLIFPCEEVLALDECSFHLNEAPRRGYSRKGLRTSI
jgi:arginine repressor